MFYYCAGVGVVSGAGVGGGVGVDWAGAEVGVELGEGVAFGDGLDFAWADFDLRWCFGVVVPVPAFSRVFPAFFKPFPTVLSVACVPCLRVWPVACAPCSIVWPVLVAPFSRVLPVLLTGFWSCAYRASDRPKLKMSANAECFIMISF